MSINLDDEDAFMASLSTAPNVVREKTEEDELPSFEVKRRKIVEADPEPVEYEKPECKYDICTIDIETNPFAYQEPMTPFVVGIYADGEYLEFWGPEKNPGYCVHMFFMWLKKKRMMSPDWKPLFYAHNGGNFDFHFFTKFLDTSTRPFVVDGRIVRAFFFGTEFRDSYKILPVPLRDLDIGYEVKGDIDYELLRPEVRYEHRDEISKYLEKDCVVLKRALDEFIERFGLRLTIAGTALPVLRSFHGFHELDERVDGIIRPYYMGGRVQAFRHGVLRGNFKMIDANSEYPAVMSAYSHPVGALCEASKEFTDATDFAYVEAENNGCLGLRTGDGGLDFTATHGKFFATAHEIRAGIETGTLRIIRVIKSWSFAKKTRFDRFVSHYYGLRLEAKAKGDKAGTLFYKLLLNSSYGKFAMESSKHKDHFVTIGDDDPPEPLMGELRFETIELPDGEQKFKCVSSPSGWFPVSHSLLGDEAMIVWQRPSRSAGLNFLNVATAASITGAARAHLLRAMALAVNPVYCDTDSIICEGFTGEEDDKKLGAWKTEAVGNRVFIAGRKMYAFGSNIPPEDESKFKGHVIDFEGERIWIGKTASKGVNLGPDQIAAICRGEVIEYSHPVPRFRLGEQPKWTKRRVQMTKKGVEHVEYD
jgi:hypothetical protein